MPSFLESVGITVAAALLTAFWHILCRNEKPEAQDLAIGVDLVVATMVLLSGFLPGSHGPAVEFRWAALVVLFAILTGMAVITKTFGYGKSTRLYQRGRRGARVQYDPIDRLTGTMAWITTMTGCVVLCAFWWLNVNVGLVVAAWKGL